jgi:hypothetical protein
MAPRSTPRSTEPHDAGGTLSPGEVLVENRTGEVEPVVAPATPAPDPRAPKVRDGVVYAYGGHYTLEDAVLLGIITKAEADKHGAQAPSA